jgi:N-methylhydantoinase A
LLVADARHDYTRTIMVSQDDVKIEEISRILFELQQEGRECLVAEGIPADLMAFTWSADLRLEGQSYDLNVSFPESGRCTREDLDSVVSAFHQLHEQIYAFKAVDEVTEWVNLRVTAVGRSPDISLPEKKSASGEPNAEAKQSRRVFFFDRGFKEVPVYERDALPAGTELQGPCLIEEVISTTVVPPEWHLTVDDRGCLLLNLKD